MLILAFTLAIAAAWLLTTAVRASATRRGWLDRPNDRSSHERPTPRGGGLAIVTVTIAGTVLILYLQDQLTWRWIIGLAASAVIALVSWIDDMRSLPTSIRFVVHVSMAVAAVAAFGPIRGIEVPGALALDISWLAVPLTVCWIAAFTNIFNFMDGIDGIAGVQAVVAGLSWMAIGSALNDSALMVAGGFLAASSLGFLLHNWSPATIFMGDVGSAFIGFLLAIFVLPDEHNPVVPLAAALPVWPFLFDGTFTLIRRIAKGENITQAHRSHLYQRLVRCGFSHDWVALLYGALATIGGLFAIAIIRKLPAWQAVYGVIPAAAIGLWIFVRRVERRQPALLADASRRVTVD